MKRNTFDMEENSLPFTLHKRKERHMTFLWFILLRIEAVSIGFTGLYLQRKCRKNLVKSIVEAEDLCWRRVIYGGRIKYFSFHYDPEDLPSILSEIKKIRQRNKTWLNFLRKKKLSEWINTNTVKFRNLELLLVLLMFCEETKRKQINGIRKFVACGLQLARSVDILR